MLDFKKYRPKRKPKTDKINQCTKRTNTTMQTVKQTNYTIKLIHVRVCHVRNSKTTK